MSTQENSAVLGAEKASRVCDSALLRAWAVVVIGYCLISSFGTLSYRTGSVLNDIAWTLSAALAAWSSYRASRSLTGAGRHAWQCFFAATAAWALGQCVWDYYEIILGVEVPFPSLADVGYVAFGPLMIAGLLLLRVTLKQRRLTWLRVANLSLVLCSFAIVLLITMTHPFAESKQSFGAALVVLAEDGSIAIGLVISIYLLWSYQWGDRLVPMTLITISLGAHMLAWVLYAREVITDNFQGLSFFNFLWVVAFAIQQCAAEAQVRIPREREADESEREDQGQVWVEVLIPSTLVLCIALSSYLLADEMPVRTIHLGSIVLGAFALLLAVRESWSYAHGQRLRGLLELSSSELARSRAQLEGLAERHSELTRAIHMTARAGCVGLWEWNARTNVVKLHDEWKRQLGYEPDELQDHFREWSRRLHPEDRDPILKDLAKYLSSPNREYVSEYRLLHRDGSYRWMLARGTMVFDDAGRHSRLMGSQVDVTSFKELEASLRASEASVRESEARYRELAGALESRVEERTEALIDAYRESRSFAYAVAHDLRAPLRAINGYNALLLESANERLTERERDLGARVREGSIRMSTLIDGLLEYSRVEHREQSIYELDCNACLNDVLSAISNDVESVGATLEVEVSHEAVLADREGLAIVLRNLIGNALKFGSSSRPLKIRVDSVIDEHQYVLRVRDNGIGFNADYREKIFNIFERLRPTEYSGTGMGLALVRKAVTRMGGRVWAESEPDRGSTFFVSLVRAHAAISDTLM